MNLVDEHDGAGIILDLPHHRFQPLLEIAAIARAREQRAHVELEDGRVGQHLRHVAHDDAPRQTFRDRGLAHAGIADEKWIVLLPAAEHLNGARDLRAPPDQGIDPARARLLIEIDAIDLERVETALLLLAAIDGRCILVHAPHRARLGHAGPLGDAVTDIIDRVEPRHVLLLQEECGMALALGKDRH